MEPSALLFIEVGGMVLLALLATAVLVAVEGDWLPPWWVERLPAPSPGPRSEAHASVPVTILCPRLEIPAGVLLGAVAGEGGLPGFSVLECELLDDTDGCGMACLEATVHRS